MLQEVQHEGKKRVWKITADKTGSLKISADRTGSLKISADKTELNLREIDRDWAYKRLRSRRSRKCANSITWEVSKGNEWWRGKKMDQEQYGNFFRKKQIQMKLRCKLFDRCTIPAIIYSCRRRRWWKVQNWQCRRHAWKRQGQVEASEKNSEGFAKESSRIDGCQGKVQEKEYLGQKLSN